MGDLMKRIHALAVIAAALVMLALMACQPGASEPPSAQDEATAPPAPQPTVTLYVAPNPTPAATPEAASGSPVGPEDFPPGVNPLTGLPVDDPSVLDRRPIIIKVSNESEDVRPQSGLSFADHVWMYQTEGWRQTRIAAIVYSQTPERVGSVRSARLVDAEHLVPMYDALLVISGAGKDMYRVLMNSPWWERVFRESEPWQVRIPDLPRPGTSYYHSLFAIPAEVWEEAGRRGLTQTPDLRGLRFDPAPPEGGQPTAELNVDFPEYGPEQTWRYDAATGLWLAWTQMEIPERYESTPDVDLLTGEQLAFENVVVLWAEHYEAEDFVEVVGVGAHLVGEGEAALLRDGLRYPATWRRSDPERLIQFFDASGEVIAFKPGRTWFMLASTETTRYPPSVEFGP